MKRLIFKINFFLALICASGLLCYAHAQEAGKGPSSAESGTEARLITIPEGISMILKDSRLVKISLKEEGMAFESSLAARSALLPQVNPYFQQGFLRNQPASKFGAQVVNTAQRQSIAYGIGVYQTLFDFGKSFSNYRAAREMVSAGRANTESVRKVAVLEFIIAYFDLLEAQKLIEVVEKEAESLSAYLNDMEHLYAQGVIVKNDLLPAKVKLADARQRLIAARNSRSTFAARLNNLLSLPLGEKIKVCDIDAQASDVPELEAAWKMAQEQRFEIKIMNDWIKSSVLSERAKAVENFPVLFGEGGYTYSQNEYQLHQDNTYVNLGVKANIFDGWKAKAEILKERYNKERLIEQRDKLIEDIKFEVQESALGLKDAREKVSVAGDALAQAEENVRANRLKYSFGSATTTDVLEAIALESGARTNFCNADYDLKRNYAKLMYSMGKDLSLIYER